MLSTPDIIGLMVRLVITISSFYLAVQLGIKQDQNKVSTTKFAMSLLYGIGIITTIQVLFILNFNGTRIQLGSFVAILDGIIGIIIVYGLLLIVSYVEENKIDPLKIGIASFLSGITILTLLFILIPDIPDIIAYTSISFVFLFFYVLIVLYKSLTRISRSMQQHNLQIIDYIRTYLVIILGGVTFVYFLASLFYIFNQGSQPTALFDLVQSTEFIIPPLLLLVGNWYFYRAFVIPDNPVLLQPQIQQKLIIMTREGTPLFDYDFDINTDIDSVLVSGALTAITSVLKEATQVAEYLGSVQLGDQILKIDTNDSLIGVLFTKQPTKIHEQVMENLMQKLGTMNDLDPISISQQQDREIRNLVEYYFGLREQIDFDN